jgi:hypothetical protein
MEEVKELPVETSAGAAPQQTWTATAKRTKQRKPPRNSSFTALPEGASSDSNEISEADRVVAIVVEAKRTHVTMSRLHSAVVLMWMVLGLFHYHPSFEARWRGYKFGILDAPSLLQNMWGAVFLALVALRHDFPLNLLGITVAAFYSGIVVGVHAVRWVH